MNHQASGILDTVRDDVKILSEKYVRKSQPNTRMELTAIYAHERTLKDVHRSEENFSARDFHNISTDTNVVDALIVFFGGDKNSARTFHLDSLFDQYAFS